MDHRWSLSLKTGCVLFAYHTHTARPVNFTPKLTPIHPNWLTPVVVVVIDKYIGLVSSGSITTPTSSFIKTKCLPNTAYIYISQKKGGGPCPLIVETHTGPCVCVCHICTPGDVCARRSRGNPRGCQLKKILVHPRIFSKKSLKNPKNQKNQKIKKSQKSQNSSRRVSPFYSTQS
jgi:hypothetical protein